MLVLESVGLVGALVVDVPNGAVGDSRESERSLLEVPLVGEVKRDVGGIVGVVVVCRFSVFGIFSKGSPLKTENKSCLNELKFYVVSL